MPETNSTETPRESTTDFVILQRHGSYQNFADQSQEISEEKLGRLTPKGEEEVKESAQVEVRKLLEFAKAQGKKINFFVLNSPSALEDTTGKKFGRRAEDTARLVVQEVKDIVAGDFKGIEVQLVVFGKTIEGARPAHRLREPNYHYVSGSEDPSGYRRVLVEKFGNSGRWEAYHNVPEELEDLRVDIGAESSPDISNRAKFLIKALDRYAAKFGYKSTDSVNVYWLTTHNDTLRALVQHGLNAGEKAKDWDPVTGSLLEMQLKDGVLTTGFEGEELSLVV